jgi:hypothetical protein
MALDMEFLEESAPDVKLVYVREYLKTAKVFSSKAEYEVCARVVEEHIGFVRTLVAENAFFHSQKLFNCLDAMAARIERLWKITRWLWSQRDEPKGKGEHTFADMGDRTKWSIVSPDQARILTSTGRMIRTVGEGTHKKWEVAE